jgi:hypothetical protein
MGILLAFAPFVVFAVIARLIGPTLGLSAGAATSAALLIRDWISPDRKPKILEIGTAILFGVLTLYSLLLHPTWSVVEVRLLVDAGLLLIVVFTMVIRKPFTLQYARQAVAPEFWNTSEFIRTNYVITAIWALAFVVMVIADLILVYAPQIPPTYGVTITVLALVGAIKFTSWYPDRKRSP